MTDTLRIELVSAATEEVRLLIDALDHELSAGYPPEQRHGLSLDAIFQPNIRFFLARLDGAAVGCGGVALSAGSAEVKRMYVADTARCRGVARAILERIEAEARDSGATVLQLETGDRQHAAMTLYERIGFRRCAAFGGYGAMAPSATTTSVFFEKHL